MAGPGHAGELRGAEEASRSASVGGCLLQARCHLLVVAEDGAGPGLRGAQQGGHLPGQVPQRLTGLLEQAKRGMRVAVVKDAPGDGVRGAGSQGCVAGFPGGVQGQPEVPVGRGHLAAVGGHAGDRQREL